MSNPKVWLAGIAGILFLCFCSWMTSAFQPGGLLAMAPTATPFAQGMAIKEAENVAELSKAVGKQADALVENSKTIGLQAQVQATQSGVIVDLSATQVAEYKGQRDEARISNWVIVGLVAFFIVAILLISLSFRSRASEA